MSTHSARLPIMSKTPVKGELAGGWQSGLLATGIVVVVKVLHGFVAKPSP